MRLGILASHPIQYQAPWFRALAAEADLQVFFAHRQSAREQADAGFGITFDWDVDLLSGYSHRFLTNVSKRPGVSHYSGCDTPEIEKILSKESGGGTEAHRSFDAFIICGWYLKSYLQAARCCRRACVPLLVRGDSHLGTSRPWWKRLGMEIRQRWLLRRFDGYLTVGKRNREYLEHYGVPANKMFFVPHFVDNDWFATQAQMVSGQRSMIRRMWGAGDDTLVVAFVGKLQPIKKPADILRALAILKSQSRAFNFLALFVGAGELEASLRAEAEALRVKVQFEGFRNQTALPRYYAAADVLVLPSESETWGLVVNEAMACGLPAIVSDRVGCAPDLVTDGETGFIFPYADCQALANRLQALAELKHSSHDFRPALAERMRNYCCASAVSETLRAVGSFEAREHTDRNAYLVT